jgi:hypothetical protein
MLRRELIIIKLINMEFLEPNMSSHRTVSILQTSKDDDDDKHPLA